MKGESDTGKEPEAQMGRRGKTDSKCGGKQAGELMDVGQRCRLRSASLQCPREAVHWTNSPALAGRQGREMGRNLSHRVSNLMLEGSPEIKQEKLVAGQQVLELITGLRTGTLAKGQASGGKQESLQGTVFSEWEKQEVHAAVKDSSSLQKEKGIREDRGEDTIKGVSELNQSSQEEAGPVGRCP